MSKQELTDGGSGKYEFTPSLRMTRHRGYCFGSYQMAHRGADEYTLGSIEQ